MSNKGEPKDAVLLVFSVLTIGVGLGLLVRWFVAGNDNDWRDGLILLLANRVWLPMRSGST